MPPVGLGELSLTAMALDIDHLITFPDPAADLPARIVHAAADAVVENWQAPDHGGPPVPKRIIPAQDLAEAWSEPEWPDRDELWEGCPETVRAEFDFSPFTYYPLVLRLYRWPGRLQAIVSLHEKAFYGAFWGSYFFHRVKAAAHADPDRWGEVFGRYQSTAYGDIDVPRREADLIGHLDAVVFAVAGAGPSEGPEDVGDAHIPPDLRPYTRLPPPTRSSPYWPPEFNRARLEAQQREAHRQGDVPHPG